MVMRHLLFVALGVATMFGECSSAGHGNHMEDKQPTILKNVDKLEYAQCACPDHNASLTNDGACPNTGTVLPYHRVIAKEDPGYVAASYLSCICVDKKTHEQFVAVSFTLTIPADGGWVGMCIGATHGSTFENIMSGGDIVMAWSNGGKVSIKDYHSASQARPVLDKEDNLFGKSHTTFTKGGITFQSFSFSRKRDTGDEEDNLVPFTGPIIVGFTYEPNKPSYYPPSGMPTWRTKIDISASRGDTSNNGSVITLHALVMGCFWGVLVPLNSMFTRYGKSQSRFWLIVHKVTGKLSAGGAVSFIAVAIFVVQEIKVDYHSFTGLFVFLFIVVIMYTGYHARSGFEHEAMKYAKKDFNRPTRVAHIVLGWVVVLVGFIQVGSGIRRLYHGDKTILGTKVSNSHGLVVAYNIWGAIYFVALVALEVRSRMSKEGADFYFRNMGRVHSGCRHTAHVREIAMKFLRKSTHDVIDQHSQRRVDSVRLAQRLHQPINLTLDASESDSEDSETESSGTKMTVFQEASVWTNNPLPTPSTHKRQFPHKE